MRIHILGVCGVFMGGLALLARALGHRVGGTDRRCYQPMKGLLCREGIQMREGYDPAGWRHPAPDLVLVGNALARDNPSVEFLLNSGLPYISGPQWLAEQVLRRRRVLAVAGTHGKTTTAAMLAWLLADAGLDPGFLVGGVAENFGVSARLGTGDFFVVEADEYDSAFFDKRSKFVHYCPRVLVLNNIEFDHMDIFDSLAAIRRQFHHLLRVVPGSGQVIAHAGDPEIQSVLEMGCWTPVERFGAPDGRWQARPLRPDWGRFEVLDGSRRVGEVQWRLFGRHNADNALAALAAAVHAGIAPESACRSLASFRPVCRRLQRLATVRGIEIYDDFAHHPTAIRATLQALRGAVGKRRILAALEPASHTMRRGGHGRELARSLGEADRVLLCRPAGLRWDLEEATAELGGRREVYEEAEEIGRRLCELARPDDVILLMSNAAFGDLPRLLPARLAADAA
ncbi:MAG: UDP-N-acetylmuramate:L-alanyl-gamma-D-glutamyl-meso-diaminopimelate ligase [Gammaproteobacteria bacterium]|nr:UDP-N-acetylmuramate:L-alanyl-gamma-D-glutamyl-meso-diaminopimelate ligase [Gammaproteobacteria bacterium]